MSNKMKVAKTNKIKSGLVPKSRFPEFHNAGGWVVKKLGEFLLKHPDYGVNAPAVPYSKDLPAYLRITDISDEGHFRDGKKASVSINPTKENYLDEGDIVLARTGASVGKSYKYRKEDGKLVFAGFLIRIKPDLQKINSTFLFNYISTEHYWNWVSLTSARSGQPGINGNEYATLSVPIPPYDKNDVGLSEQQKIADCLSSVDDLIVAQGQKVDALKKYKNGLMRQLFPIDGETTPRLRFPEFHDAGEWEVKSLEYYLDYQQPTAHLVSDTNYSDDYETPVLTAGKTFLLGYTNERHGIFKDDLPVVIFDDFTTATQFVDFPFKAKSSAMKILRAKNGANIKFMHEAIKIIPYEVGSHERHWISKFAPMLVLVPKPKEQQKIASCISSLDDLVTTQSKKLETLKAHKKGLMQQLFPTVSEVQE